MNFFIFNLLHPIICQNWMQGQWSIFAYFLAAAGVSSLFISCVSCLESCFILHCSFDPSFFISHWDSPQFLHPPEWWAPEARTKSVDSRDIFNRFFIISPGQKICFLYYIKKLLKSRIRGRIDHLGYGYTTLLVGIWKYLVRDASEDWSPPDTWVVAWPNLIHTLMK